jgi:hypothetical protein
MVITDASLHRSAVLIVAATAWTLLDCGYDRADRWDDMIAMAPPAPICATGELRCGERGIEQCQATSSVHSWKLREDCASSGLVCALALGKCAVCVPTATECDGQNVTVCSGDGSAREVRQTCDPASGYACRDGACLNLCDRAAVVKSNVGCEYWGVDLDNAMIDATTNAAGQQYAIVVSNPQPDVATWVTIEQDDSDPGATPDIKEIARADIQPLNLRVFKLGPREVDGSPQGEFNTGTGTALTRHAYRIRSKFPVVAYQFNPLDNVGVFSNDASLLKPVEALTDDARTIHTAYVVVGWPQTIASTDNPDTNFDPTAPIDLRVFVTIVGTRPDTHVRFTTRTRTIAGSGLKGSPPLAGGDIPETPPGGVVERILQPFDVLNLESGGFNADFTGSIIDADEPVVVYSGGEASDAPFFEKLANRFCCADHLEEQIDPIRTAGKTFVAPHSPSRTMAIEAAGATLGVVDEPEYFRVVAMSDEGPTLVSTTLPAPNDIFTLPERGAYRDLTAWGSFSGSHQDFMVTTDRPVVLGNVQPSQESAYVKRGLPGGDPSLIVIPPMEQYRPDYVFLTPDKYAFDFIVIAAPREASVLLDGNRLDYFACTASPADGLSSEGRNGAQPSYVVHRCQLSYPVIDPNLDPPKNVLPGNQNDGVHRVQADMAVMVLAYGFDNYVSYGYAAGTQLETLGPMK